MFIPTNQLFDVSKLPELLSRYDMVYTELPEKLEQGAPLGNGDIGAVVYGATDCLEINLDRADIWETRHWEPNPQVFTWKNYCKRLKAGDGGNLNGFCNTEAGATPTRLPLGRLSLSLGKEIERFNMRLSLYDGIARGEAKTKDASVSFEAYVLADRPVFVIDCKPQENIDVAAYMKYANELGVFTREMEQLKETGASCRLKKNLGLFISGYDEVPEVARIMRDWGYPTPEYSSGEDIEIMRQVIPENGDYAVAVKKMREENRVVFAVSIMTDRTEARSADKAIAYLEDITLSTIENHKAAQCEWWHDYYKASFISIPEAELEAFYWAEMYMFGCMTRPGSIAMTLSGPWTPADGIPAYCANDYHWNLEQQAQLWPAYTSNRLEYAMPMYDLVDKCRPNMKEFCRKFFERDGEFLTHCSDLDLKPLYNNPDHFEFCSLMWMTFQYWMHWRYSMDDEFLKDRCYPLMREALRPILDEFVKGEDGKLHLPWTSSPEYHSSQETYRWPLGQEPDWKVRFGPDCVMDLALVRFCCETLISITDRLNIDDPERRRWEKTLTEMTDFPLDQFGGYKVRGDLALTSSHRHQSHLFPIFPLHLVTFDESSDIINKSMSVVAMTGHAEWDAWSFPWVAALYARAQRPELTRNLLMDFVERYTTANAWTMNGPIDGKEMSMHQEYGMTLESGCMAASAIMDMLIQSHNGVIRVFPAIPKAWKDIGFWKLRAEGAFLVSAGRRNRKTQFVQVLSEVGGVCRIRSDFAKDVSVTTATGAKVYKIEGNDIVFDTVPGEEVLISGGDYEIPIFDTPIYARNYYGLKD